MKARFDVEALYLQFIKFSSLVNPLKNKTIVGYIWWLAYRLPKVQLTEQQRLLGSNPFGKQSVMAPHDIVACLYEYPEFFSPVHWGAWSFGPVLDGKLGPLLIAQDA